MDQQYVFKNPAKRLLMKWVDKTAHLFTDPFHSAKPAPLIVNQLLLVRLDHLGDVICLLPLIDSISQLQPKPYLGVCVSTAGAQLLRDVPGIDDVIVFDAPWFARSYTSSTSFVAIGQFIRTLRKKRFDVSFELRGDIRHHLILTLAKIPYRIGYGITGGSFLLHRNLPWDKDMSPVDLNISFLQCLQNAPTESVDPHLFWRPSSDELSWLKANLPSGDLLLFHVDAGTPAKRWPTERFVQLAQLAHSQHMIPVFIGTNPHLGIDLSNNTNQIRVINLLGKTTLAQMVTLIQHSAGLVSTDSGPAHIASALGKPTFIVWSGTSDPSIWKPRGDYVSIVQHHVPCEYCANTICPLPRPLCTDDLTFELVLPAFKSFLLSLGKDHDREFKANLNR